jgi:hypothetical protein
MPSDLRRSWFGSAPMNPIPENPAAAGFFRVWAGALVKVRRPLLSPGSADRGLSGGGAEAQVTLNAMY